MDRSHDAHCSHGCPCRHTQQQAGSRLGLMIFHSQCPPMVSDWIAAPCGAACDSYAPAEP